MTAFCRYHCRACGGHFSSLEAFDAHRSGPFEDRACSYPDDAGLVELDGTCKVADPDRPQVGAAVYSTERASRAKDYFNGRERAPANRREVVAA